MKLRMCGLLLTLGVVGGSRPRLATAQELGHKLLGGIGINAGTQPAPGLYVLDRFVVYRAQSLRDRNGNLLPIESLGIDVAANVLGVAYTRALRDHSFYSAAAGAPLARVDVGADHPQIAVDASGFGDVFVQPVKLGARFDHFDVVGDYTLYIPSGHFEPRRLSVGRGYWTNQVSVGGAFHADRRRARRASLLASYDINRRKRDIDIKRGNSFQVQGGAGTQLYGPVDGGVAGFALWQVTDNSGTDLPSAVRGARARVFGLGPEVGVAIPSIRARIEARTEWEFGARSRQEGWIAFFGAAFQACCSATRR